MAFSGSLRFTCIPSCLLLFVLVAFLEESSVRNSRPLRSFASATKKERGSSTPSSTTRRCLELAADPLQLQSYVHWNETDHTWAYPFPFISHDGEEEELLSSAPLDSSSGRRSEEDQQKDNTSDGGAHDDKGSSDSSKSSNSSVSRFPSQVGMTSHIVHRLQSAFGGESTDSADWMRTPLKNSRGRSSQQAERGGSSPTGGDDEGLLLCRRALSLPFRTRDQLVEALQGKHILFVGDSTVRGIGLNLLAMMCNPTWFDQCQQVANYPYMDEGYSNCMNCTKKQMREYSFLQARQDLQARQEDIDGDDQSARKEEQALKERWAHVEARNRRLSGEVLPNACKKELEITETWLPGLTEPRGYRTKAERAKVFWLEKRIAPMSTLKFRNFTISTIEVACNGERNGMGKAWKYILESRRAAKKGKLSKTAQEALEVMSVKEEEERWQQKLKEDAEKRKRLGDKLREVDMDDVGDNTVFHNPTEFPVVPDFDIMATSAMFHCKLKTDFHSVPLSERFYMQGPPIFKAMREELGIRTLWLETPYCSSSDCKAFRRHAERIQAFIFRREGIPVFPTYFMTSGSRVIARNKPVPTELEKIPCLYVDPKHATLTCYRSMVTLFVRSVLNILMVPLSVGHERGGDSGSQQELDLPPPSVDTASSIIGDRTGPSAVDSAAITTSSLPPPDQTFTPNRKKEEGSANHQEIGTNNDIETKSLNGVAKTSGTTELTEELLPTQADRYATEPRKVQLVSTVIRKNRGRYGMAQLGVDLRMVLLVVLIPAAALLYRLGGKTSSAARTTRGGGGGGTAQEGNNVDDDDDARGDDDIVDDAQDRHGPSLVRGDKRPSHNQSENAAPNASSTVGGVSRQEKAQSSKQNESNSRSGTTKKKNKGKAWAVSDFLDAV